MPAGTALTQISVAPKYPDSHFNTVTLFFKGEQHGFTIIEANEPFEYDQVHARALPSPHPGAEFVKLSDSKGTTYDLVSSTRGFALDAPTAAGITDAEAAEILGSMSPD